MMVKNLRSAVILAGAAGTRMRPLTNYFPKALLPLGDRPMLLRHLERLERFGIKDVIIVVDPIFGPIIEHSLQIGYRGTCHIRHVVQAEHKGIGDAVRSTQAHLLNSSFILILCDEYCESNELYERITHGQPNLECACLSLHKATTVEEIRATASVQTDHTQSFIRRFVEKPDADAIVGDLIFAGQAIFDTELFKTLDAVACSQSFEVNGELSIGHAIQMMIDQGLQIGYVLEQGRHVHLTTLSDYWRHGSFI